MIRATTPRHEFLFEDDPDGFAKMLVTYTQGGKIVLEKDKGDMTFETINGEGGTNWLGWLRLTQEETKLFNDRTSACVQVRVLTTSGNAYASQIFHVCVNQVLNDTVMGNNG